MIAGLGEGEASRKRSHNYSHFLVAKLMIVAFEALGI